MAEWAVLGELTAVSDRDLARNKTPGLPYPRWGPRETVAALYFLDLMEKYFPIAALSSYVTHFSRGGKGGS